MTSSSVGEMAALECLDSLSTTHPEHSDWYNTLADLYQRKLWHQLTLKLQQFAVFHLAHFAVMVSRQYSEKVAAIGYLDGVKESRIEEPVLYIKMQIAMYNLETGDQKECKKLLEDGKSALDSMTDIDPSVRPSEDSTIPLRIIAERTKLSVEGVEYLLMKSLSVHLIEGIIDQVDGPVYVSWVQPRVLGISQIKSLHDRLDSWVGKVRTALVSVEVETPDLVAT